MQVNIDGTFGLRNRQTLFWLFAFICGFITLFYAIDTYTNPLNTPASSMRISGDHDRGIRIEESPFAFIDRMAQTAKIIAPAILFTFFWIFLAWRCGVAIQEAERHEAYLRAQMQIIKLLRR